MNSIQVLEQIVTRLADLEQETKNSYMKCAVSEQLLKYCRMLEKAQQENANNIVKHSISDLTNLLEKPI
jgi:hypothetical protein